MHDIVTYQLVILVRPHPATLFQVMYNTEQVPLAVDLVSASQGKPVQYHHPADGTAKGTELA